MNFHPYHHPYQSVPAVPAVGGRYEGNGYREIQLSRGKQRRTVCEQTRTGVRAKVNSPSLVGLEEA
jgi:hypothetical protein